MAPRERIQRERGKVKKRDGNQKLKEVKKEQEIVIENNERIRRNKREREKRQRQSGNTNSEGEREEECV